MVVGSVICVSSYERISADIWKLYFPDGGFVNQAGQLLSQAQRRPDGGRKELSRADAAWPADHHADLVGIGAVNIDDNAAVRDPRASSFLRSASRAAGQRHAISAAAERTLEKLKGNEAGQHSIRINDQCRICFTWTEAGATDVEITDYH
jgi:hypothetical protein